MGKVRCLSSIALVLASLALIGCSGGFSLFSHHTPDPGTVLPAALSSIALPSDRQTAGLTETLIQGKYTLSRSAGATDNGTALVLDATASGLEWGIYGFTPGVGSLDSLAVQLDATAGDQVWIGLADYSKGGWEWHGPFSAGKVLAIDSSKYLSPGGLFATAVVTAGENTATVNALSIRTINPQNEPPSASLNADVLSGDAPLTVQFDAGGSTDPDGLIIEYAWDWEGDGVYDGFSDATAVSHTFAPGLYTVRMRVTDDQFARATAEVEINVTAVGNLPPVADLQPPSAAGNTPYTVNFDASASNAGGDPGDSIVKYEWDFDGNGIYDGYGEIPTTSHVYMQAGTFTAKLRVTDSAGNQASDTSTITVNVAGNAAPTANLQPPSSSGNTPLLVSFNASGSSDSDGSITQYEWDFDGDGNYDGYGTDPTIGHTYTQAGTFTARLRVTDDDGAQATDTSTITVNVPGNDAPIADLQPASQSGDLPLTVSFDASNSQDADGSIAKYEWDFDGDGIYDGYGEEPAVDHVFTSAGEFISKLRVTDNVGAQATDTSTITVNVPGNDSPVASLSANPLTGDTPLTVNFDASGSSDGDGSVVRYDWDFDGDGNYELYDGDTTPSWTYTSAGDYDAAVRVTDDVGAQDTATVAIGVNVPGNAVPVADLAADKTESYAPFTITFDASGSSDSDGTIELYEWDFDGDGNYEEYGATESAIYTYPVYGNYLTGVRVTDDDGAQDTAVLQVTLPTAWWMFGMEPTHNRRSPFIGAQTNNVQWSYTTGGVVPSSPALAADGTVYVGSFDGKLYALNPDGSLKWSYPTGNSVYSSPAIGADGTVYVGSLDNKLHALNPDGSLKWSYTTGDWIYSSPAIGADGTVYVGSNDYKLYALNPDGSLKWSYTTGYFVWSSPALAADGMVYVGSIDGKLYALNPDGSLQWSYTTENDVYSSPAVGSDGTVYIGGVDGKLYALNPDGSLQWFYTTGSDVHSSPAIAADGTVYVGSLDNKLYALNPDGSLQWSYTTENWVLSSPAIAADGTVYVGSEDDKVYALNSDGSLKWSYTTGNDVRSSPAIAADGTVYIGSDDGKLYAFGPP